MIVRFTSISIGIGIDIGIIQFR